jgi:hypothetical protein
VENDGDKDIYAPEEKCSREGAENDERWINGKSVTTVTLVRMAAGKSKSVTTVTLLNLPQ